MSEVVIRGLSASPGIARGKVTIIKDAKDVDKAVETDIEILVSSFVSPSLSQLIKKAKAIVLEKGGITTHVAVLAREFGIPCVVGAKNATSLLKDGDIVIVDASKGVVKRE